MVQRRDDRTIVSRDRSRPRRNNAPIRPARRRKATIVPDFILMLATVAWTMAVVFLAASFMSDDVTSGEAGRVLARLFAGALFASGFFMLLFALALLRDDRGDP